MIGNGADDDFGLTAAQAWIAARGDFFDLRRPVLIARAPGRLDMMGGVADYSGSLILALPLAVATWVAVQDQQTPELVIESTAGGGVSDDARVTIPIADLTPGPPLTYAEAYAHLAAEPRRAWAAYVAGALVVLQREHGRRLPAGARVLVRSDVPVGKGVSSSAALEVAAFDAMAVLAGATIDDRALALGAQTVENRVVGAPCGVMDQMTATCGRRDHLLELLCQPAEVVGHLPIPSTLEVFGIDSGVRHAVSGAGYRDTRAAAFMGYRMITAAAGLDARPVAPGRVAIDDPRFGGYLANVSPAEWQSQLRAAVPERLTGREFLSRFGGSTDGSTTIDEMRTYAVRAATEHPILEHDRIRRFRALLTDGAPGEDVRAALGTLMYESHASYSACGLGHEGTDRIVELCRGAGPAAGVYGARVTGGGSGGTIAVLAAAGRRSAIEDIARRYERDSGRATAIFSGSSPGARPFGVRSFMRL